MKKNMKALVTGANGFLGAAVVRELQKSGFEIIAVVRNETSDISQIANLNRVNIVFCELENIGSLQKILEYETGKIDLFYHFAWSGSAGTMRGSETVQLLNIKGTCDAVRVCKELGCHRFIFAASIMEKEIAMSMNNEFYGGSINDLYAVAKLSADYMARIIANSLHISYISGLISNVYGEGEKSPRLVNSSIRKLLTGVRPSFTAGEQEYDFIYIIDAAKAFVAIGISGADNKTYYIGSQNPRPLKDFLIEMKNAVDSKLEIGLGELPFTGVKLDYNSFGIYEVEQDTGFVPEITFSEGIKKTSDWIRNQI